MTTQTVLMCKQFSQSADGVISCSAQVWSETYVITPDQQAQLELVINGGFDYENFLQFFWGTIGLFIVGFATGIIISQVRKVRRG